MPNDQESQDLVSQIRELYGRNVQDFRFSLIAESGEFLSRQRVNCWLNHTGIPKKHRDAIGRVLERRRE